MAKFFLASSAFLFSSALWAAPMAITSSEVTFQAVGKPGFLRINGTGGTVTGSLNKEGNSISGELKSSIKKYETGITMRDEHMRDKYLEVKKYPDAILKINKFEVDSKGEANDKPFKGMLTLHGQTKEVEGKASVSGGKIEASFPIVISDFKIDIPSYAGVKVAEKVDIVVKLSTK